jgi:hypothetical protein
VYDIPFKIPFTIGSRPYCMVMYSLVVTLENSQLVLSNLNDIIIPLYTLTKNLLKKEGFRLKGGSALV